MSDLITFAKAVRLMRDKQELFFREREGLAEAIAQERKVDRMIAEILDPQTDLFTNRPDIRSAAESPA